MGSFFNRPDFNCDLTGTDRAMMEIYEELKEEFMEFHGIE